MTQESVPGVVRALYLSVKLGEQDIIAYKGGRFEKNLLDQLNIPAIDLSDFDCPSFKHLTASEREKYSHLNCGQHRFLRDGAHTFHCATMEVAFHRDWLIDELHKLQRSDRTKTCSTRIVSPIDSSSSPQPPVSLSLIHI